MMQQTRNYRGPYLNDNYDETPEVTIAENNAIANANIDVIEVGLNRASICWMGDIICVNAEGSIETINCIASTHVTNYCQEGRCI